MQCDAKWKLWCRDWTSPLSWYNNPVVGLYNCTDRSQVFPIQLVSHSVSFNIANMASAKMFEFYVESSGQVIWVRRGLFMSNLNTISQDIHGDKRFVKIILRNDCNCNIQSFVDQNYLFLVNSFRFIKHENAICSIMNVFRCKLIN